RVFLLGHDREVLSVASLSLHYSRGESKAYLFVAVLPYSGMVFCHAYLNMKTSAWLDAHVRAFALFEGVPQLVVPDNAATATHRMSKADRARVVTARYQELADHLNRPGNNGDSEATERTSLSCPKRNTPSSCAREPSAWSSTLSKQTLVPAAASSAVSATSSAGTLYHCGPGSTRSRSMRATGPAPSPPMPSESRTSRKRTGTFAGLTKSLSQPRLSSRRSSSAPRSHRRLHRVAQGRIRSRADL